MQTVGVQDRSRERRDLKDDRQATDNAAEKIANAILEGFQYVGDMLAAIHTEFERANEREDLRDQKKGRG